MPNVSPSQRNATALAATGSSIATIPTRVAEMWRSAAATSRNVTIVPTTTTKSISSQTGSANRSRCPSSETLSSSRPAGKRQSGCTTAQKSAAKRKP